MILLTNMTTALILPCIVLAFMIEPSAATINAQHQIPSGQSVISQQGLSTPSDVLIHIPSSSQRSMEPGSPLTEQSSARPIGVPSVPARRGSPLTVLIPLVGQLFSAIRSAARAVLSTTRQSQGAELTEDHNHEHVESNLMTSSDQWRNAMHHNHEDIDPPFRFAFLSTAAHYRLFRYLPDFIPEHQVQLLFNDALDRYPEQHTSLSRCMAFMLFLYLFCITATSSIFFDNLYCVLGVLSLILFVLNIIGNQCVVHTFINRFKRHKLLNSYCVFLLWFFSCCFWILWDKGVLYLVQNSVALFLLFIVDMIQLFTHRSDDHLFLLKWNV